MQEAFEQSFHPGKPEKGSKSGTPTDKPSRIIKDGDKGSRKEGPENKDGGKGGKGSKKN